MPPYRSPRSSPCRRKRYGRFGHCHLCSKSQTLTSSIQGTSENANCEFQNTRSSSFDGRLIEARFPTQRNRPERAISRSDTSPRRSGGPVSADVTLDLPSASECERMGSCVERIRHFDVMRSQPNDDHNRTKSKDSEHPNGVSHIVMHWYPSPRPVTCACNVNHHTHDDRFSAPVVTFPLLRTGGGAEDNNDTIHSATPQSRLTSHRSDPPLGCNRLFDRT